LLATAGYTAPLDFLSFNGSGATGTLDAHLSVFDNLAAGASQAYQATFNAAQLGTLSSNYDLTLSDDTSLLGAVGGQHLFLTLTGTGIQFPGDVNLDGTVNGLDISELSSHWLNTDPGDPADLNGDGAVNGLDIAEIAGNWLNSVASGGGTAAVPEPGGILLAASCLALFGTRRTVRALRRSRRDGAVRR